MIRLSVLLTLPVYLATGVAAAQDVAGESLDELIAAGRTLLDDDRPAEAEASFARAAELDGGTLASRTWVLRAWMDQGRSNATLDALDALARAGAEGPAMDYLYGMAFTRRAEGHIAAGVTDSSITMNFQDATGLLRRAVEADPVTYRDAYLALANAAWYTQDLEQARWAADRAVEATPELARAWLVLGRVAMSQFVSEVGGEEWSAAAQAHWSASNDAFARAVDAFGRPVRLARQVELADAALQLGHSLVWNGRRAEAADAYAVAISWAPETVDYASLNGLLAPTSEDAEIGPFVHFNRALETGSARFAAIHGAQSERDSVLVWWLGWSRLSLERPAEAEAAFLACVERNPLFANSWFYVAMARYEQSDWAGVADALQHGWDVDPAAIVTETKSDAEVTVQKLDFVLGQIYSEQADLLACALLAEVCAETALDDPRHWNNMGLFLRDEADRMLLEEEEPASEVLTGLYERAYVAYTRSLELSPDDPQVLNDTAVMLDYYLQRDLERALEMYERAGELAAERLTDEELSETDRERFQTAYQDATDNARALAERIAGRDGGSTAAEAASVQAAG